MTLTDDTFYELLGNERRRACLERLVESGTEWSVSDLSRAVAADITDSSTSPEEIYDSVYISLCQNHLPKLDEVDLIEYDLEAKTVRPGPGLPAIANRLPTSQPAATPESARMTIVAISSLTVVLAGAAAVLSSNVARYPLAVMLVVHLSTIFLLGFRQFRSQSG
ncbi:DUF7344 domain-containing protein [Halorientalis salina]|uniref:DUF7344 domain-containing protein n=1 Tax=Halorientalis salina TaxID=2932266 RepID=UPI0010ACC0EE|nr:hypothetical protein [Halorientalis salina]